MRFVFYKHQLTWPRQSGHDVHSAEMMRALAAKGHAVLFLSRTPPEAGATDGLGLEGSALVTPEPEDERFRPAGLQAQVFFVLGRRAPVCRGRCTCLPPISARTCSSRSASMRCHTWSGDHRAVSVWYAADEWVLHHLSQFRALDRPTWINLRQAAVKGVYQRAFTPDVDRMWVVTEQDRWAARWIAGARHVDVIPNGVDVAYFSPRSVEERPDTAVFWGRLDFGPNVQALEWVVRQVWPRVREQRPEAVLRIIGFKPGDEVRRLAAEPGVSLQQDLPDLRDEVCRHAVAIAPMVSGLGIKNKLLEAAAMGRADSLHDEGDARPRPARLSALRDCGSSRTNGRGRCWRCGTIRRSGVSSAPTRVRWVTSRHSWSAAADLALRGIGSMDDRCESADDRALDLGDRAGAQCRLDAWRVPDVDQ